VSRDARPAGRPTDSASAAVRVGDWIVRRGWLAWGAVVLAVSVVPVAWVFGLTPRSTWSWSAAAGHFFEFALLAVLVALSRARAVPGSGGLRTGAAVAVTYGLVIELVQAPIPYRSADWRDFVTDVCGAATGLAVLWYWRRRRARRLPESVDARERERGGSGGRGDALADETIEGGSR